MSDEIGTPPLSITNNSNTHAVIQLQELLNAKGANIYPDGRFAIGTDRALAAFQEGNGLEVTGYADEATWKKLRQVKKAPAKKKAETTKKAPAKKAPAKKAAPKAKAKK